MQWHCISTRGMSISSPCGSSLLLTPPLPQCSSSVVSSVVNTSCGWFRCSFPALDHTCSPHIYTHTRTHSVDMGSTDAVRTGPIKTLKHPRFVHTFLCMFTLTQYRCHARRGACKHTHTSHLQYRLSAVIWASGSVCFIFRALTLSPFWILQKTFLVLSLAGVHDVKELFYPRL